MRPPLIEVGAVFLQAANHLATANNQPVIQTFTPQTPDKSFTDRIRTWRFVGRVDDLDAGGLGHPLQQATILLVIVADQVLRLLRKRRRAAHLLREPLVRRGGPSARGTAATTAPAASA